MMTNSVTHFLRTILLIQNESPLLETSGAYRLDDILNNTARYKIIGLYHYPKLQIKGFDYDWLPKWSCRKNSIRERMK